MLASIVGEMERTWKASDSLLGIYRLPTKWGVGSLSTFDVPYIYVPIMECLGKTEPFPL